jgi:ABC-type nitrate/sulfonate/bicarbonate transport system ATPase subunit
MDKHFIKVENLAVDYQTRQGTLRALDNINFSVAEGEFLTLVGPSGCGKSTLLRVLAGFVPISAGSVMVKSEPIVGPHYSRGVVFQQANLYPWFTAQGNVEFGLKARKIAQQEREQMAESMLKLVGLWDFRDAFPYELSGGMQQRVSIARSLANHPEILLMDEPFSALDEFTRTQLQEEIKAIWQKQNQTIVFVTHNVDEALYLSSTIIVMASKPGRITEIVKPTFNQHESALTAREVRSLPEFLDKRNHLINLIEDAHVAAFGNERQ